MSIFPLDHRPESSQIIELFREVRCAAMEFVFPPACMMCRSEMPHRIVRTAGSTLCDDCLSKLDSGQRNACRRCGAPVGPFTVAADHCILCHRENYAFDGVIRMGLYRDSLRVACLMAKNPSGALMSRTLADLLVDSQYDLLSEKAFHAVIPVPEHWAKRLIRPHYAAETIARQISTRLKVKLATGILAKARWTPKQAKSPPVQRRQQQKDAFHVVGAGVQGQSILLVDDILTTGATADAAARVLKRAGASRVVVAVVAVSPPRA